MDLAQSNVHAHNKTKGILELPSSLWYQSWCDWRWHVIESWSSSIWRWQTKFNFSGIGPWCVHAEGEAKAPEAVVEVRDAMYPVGTWGLIWRAGFVDLSIQLRKCWATPKSAHVVVDMICWWAHINLCGEGSSEDWGVSSCVVSCSCAWGEGLQETVVNLYYSRWKREGEEHLCTWCYPAVRGHLCRFDICSWSLRRKR
jgi:hypothetical protein